MQLLLGLYATINLMYNKTKTMFIPKNSEMLGIQQEQFSIAEKRLREGHNPLAVFKSTGCFQTPDGVMKMEIPDNKATIGTPMRSHARIKAKLQDIVNQYREGKITLEEAKPIHEDLLAKLRHEEWRIDNETPGTLSFYLQHEKLYEAYPSIRELPIRLFSDNNSNVGGFVSDYHSIYSYDRALNINRNYINDEEKLEKFLLHEVQHIIQTDHNWSVGGCSEQFIPREIGDTLIERHQAASEEYETLNLLDIKKRVSEAAKTFPKGHWADFRLDLARAALTREEKTIISNYTLCLKEGQTQHQRYRNLLGEIEAYAVMDRKDMTDEELKAALPLMSQKEHLKDMIVGTNFLIDNKFLNQITKHAARELKQENEQALTA